MSVDKKLDLLRDEVMGIIAERDALLRKLSDARSDIDRDEALQLLDEVRAQRDALLAEVRAWRSAMTTRSTTNTYDVETGAIERYRVKLAEARRLRAEE